MCVGHRDHEPIHSYAVGARRNRCDAPVQYRRAERQVCDDDCQPVPAAIREHQYTRVEAQAIAARLSALGAFAGEADARGRGDVDAGETGPQGRSGNGARPGAQDGWHVESHRTAGREGGRCPA